MIAARNGIVKWRGLGHGQGDGDLGLRGDSKGTEEEDSTGKSAGILAATEKPLLDFRIRP